MSSMTQIYDFAFVSKDESIEPKLHPSIKDIITKKPDIPLKAPKIQHDCNSTVAIPNELIEAKVKAKILKPLCFILANANMIDSFNPDYLVLRMNAEEFLKALDLNISKHPTQSLRRVIDPIDKFLDVFNPNLHVTFLYSDRTKEVTIYHNIDKPTKFFSQLPYKIINNKLVSTELATVYLALDYCSRTNKHYAGLEYIAEKAGMDRRKCTKLLNELERLNLVTIIKEKGKSNAYRLTSQDGTYLYTHIEYEPIFRP
ncbi:hypothetical protein ACSXEL_17315 (plasmid) [Clostridium perfringens]